MPHVWQSAHSLLMSQYEYQLREPIVLDGFQAPFSPVVAHRLLLKCSYRGDSVTRD